MSNGPEYVAAIVERLASAGLFHFSDEARKEIDSFFAGAGVESGILLEQGRALSHLHAAEFALEPAFIEPGSLGLPPSEPVNVSIREARLALLKGDCSLIIWTHAPAQERITSRRSTRKVPGSPPQAWPPAGRCGFRVCSGV
jgi:hypothetical protein